MAVTRRLFALALVVLCLCFTSAAVPAPQAPPEHQGHQWWHHAIVYEIYPRSFADSDNDGIGDLNGITSKLDYLQALGIDAVWLTPCYPSPQVDFGYDVADYTNINPAYGTLKDFDRLVTEADKRGIRVLMDLVLNHTSDRHPWFIDSRSSRASPRRDWYVWRDGRAPGEPPNNWQSLFGGSAWEFDHTTGQYYYHFFYKEQPDLDWRNPQVKNAMFDVARFWLDRGVAGFRLDAVVTLFEDLTLPDNPGKPGLNWVGDPAQEYRFNWNLPPVHDALRELRQVLDRYDDRVLIGETVGDDIARLSQFYGPHQDEVQLPMNFFFADVASLSASEFRQQIALWDNNPAGGWPLYYLSNHDRDRHFTRYGDGDHNDAIAKLTAALLLTTRGTPILYYGEEIGMENNDPKSREEVKDPIGKLFWPNYKGRDGERTPMQWDDSPHAGFSEVAPWLPVPASYHTHNVAAQAKAPNSVLNFYRALISLRRQSPALLDGAYVALNASDKHVLSYLRQHPEETVLVVLNMSAQPQTVRFDLAPFGLASEGVDTLLTTSNEEGKQRKLAAFRLEPFEVYMARVPDERPGTK